jgi:NTP pyrophosphatase (non-canonical NTP hydrolase)
VEKTTSDHQTTIADLRKLVQHFVEERDWGGYHTPKNLAMSIAIESAELMENFQWHTPEESIQVLQNPESRQEVVGELADVLIYCIVLANQADIDISRAIEATLRRNEGRFPIGYKPT